MSMTLRESNPNLTPGQLSMTSSHPIHMNPSVYSFYSEQKASLHFGQRTDDDFITFLLDTVMRVTTIVHHLAPVIEVMSGVEDPKVPHPLLPDHLPDSVTAAPVADSLSTAQVIRIVPDSLRPFNVPDSLPPFNEDSISANTSQDIVSPGKRKRGHTERTAVETAPDPADVVESPTDFISSQTSLFTEDSASLDDIDLPTLTEVDEPSLSELIELAQIDINKEWIPGFFNLDPSADERMDLMMDLFHILSDKDTRKFPPPKSQTDCGFNFNLMEDILCGIQARLCLYLICKDTGFAARAFSSIDVENAHSIINHLLRTGAQTCTVEEMARLMSHLQRMQILSKKKVGRTVLKPSSSIYPTPRTGAGLADVLTSCAFDKTRSNKDHEARPYSRNMAPRNQTGVRTYGHKSGEASFYS